MLDSKLCLSQQLNGFNEFCTEVDQDHSKQLLQSSTSYISMENSKATYFLKDVEFWRH